MRVREFFPLLRHARPLAGISFPNGVALHRPTAHLDLSKDWPRYARRQCSNQFDRKPRCTTGVALSAHRHCFIRLACLPLPSILGTCALVSLAKNDGPPIFQGAPDWWDSARFTGIFPWTVRQDRLASSFSCSQTESTPAHTQVTQTVGTPLAKVVFQKRLLYMGLFMYRLSDKLQKYIAKVEQETGRQVLIQTVQNVGLSGMTARFSEHPTHILIEVAASLQRDEQTEQSIAHEATHGLLAYSKGYCRTTPKHSLHSMETNSISILVTMVEDIVVNKIIQENGFWAHEATYLETVKKETKALRKNQDYYREFQNPFKDRFMVFRYIMAWGFLQYYDIDESTRTVLARFENDFRLSRPKQYKVASQIREILLQNDIFSADGYCQAIKESLRVFELDHLVNIESYV